jgi:hypothetical protein
MKKHVSRIVPMSRLSGAILCAALSAPSWADGLPSLGEDSSPWKTDVYYENHTAFRSNGVGLSKFRNTLQAESDKGVGDGWNFHSVLRGTYDGVYDLNSSKFGNDAGGPIQLQSSGTGAMVNWGQGTVSTGTAHFGFNTAANPNQGLTVLGSGWHPNDGGVSFGVPVRPCDVDRRGCVDFGGYGDLTKNELASPEFNRKLDFIREAYVKKTFDLKDGSELFVKVGRQQIVWGRTDLFRVLDVFNPVDYSRNNIYDELQDIRIPLWSLQAEWRLGGSDLMQDRNIQFVWSFDQFRANNLGQCGSPNSVLDAGCFFRGMKNLWDNGGTVQNFANGNLATDFPAHSIGIRNVNLPKWSDAGSIGVKYEGVTMSGTAFSLNALSYRSQLPSLHGGKGAYDPFAGTWGSSWPYLIAFDMEFPRINLIGGSMDFQSEALGASFRLEGAFTSGEEFANSARSELYSKNNVFRSVIGVDRPMFIPFINPNRTTLISAQLFYQHIFNHELHSGVGGNSAYMVGMPDWENNVIGTVLIKGFMNGDRVSPQLILARDFKAQAWAAAPQVEWSLSDDLKLTFGANIKGRSGTDPYSFDDARSNAPFPALGVAGAYGALGGIEPLGRFRAGPIGTAFNQNDVYFMMRYKF